MFNYTNYPTADMSYKVETCVNVTPSQLNSVEESKDSTPSVSDLTEQSSPLLISHKEVLDMFQITSKATIYKWRQSRGFPDPVTLMPLRWLRSAVEEWKVRVGGCSR
ncbi:hypothetical protein L4D76_22350 [Photobacterium sagamiensis]|uniref:helix-turn-helix transcriptional regulator n=1 Tax=Photobacterium sagamiensis TaxID=2910241 RepID=UPI003D0A9E93